MRACRDTKCLSVNKHTDQSITKTSILPKDTSQQAVFDVARSIIAVNPALNLLNDDIVLHSFCPDGFIGIGVPIGTDAFVQSFVAKTCRDIIDDVEKLDAIQDGLIHYQLLRFCQATRLQYINSHIMLPNRCVLQQQHVDCKIADALLKKGTKQHADAGTRLVKPGHTCAFTCLQLREALV